MIAAWNVIGGFSGLIRFGLGFLLMYIVSVTVLEPLARNEGRSRYIAEQAVQDQKSELERKGDDAKIQRMSDYDLCVAYLGRVPDCDSLKLQPLRQE